MARTHRIDIQNMRFDPAELTIATGDSVEWTNRMAMLHTVDPDNGEFEGSGPLQQNATFSHVFDAEGTVSYHCEIHPFMTGAVTVASKITYSPEIGRTFWFEFDGATKYNPDFMNVIGQAGGFGVQRDFETMRDNGTYPAAFKRSFSLGVRIGCALLTSKPP
jgi:hypothetical protein